MQRLPQGGGCFFIAPHVVEDLAFLPHGPGVVGLEGKGAVEIGEGGVILLKLALYVAEDGKGEGIVLGGGRDLEQYLQGLFGVAQGVEDLPFGDEEPGGVGFEGKGLLKDGEGFLGLVEGLVGDAGISQHKRVTRYNG